MDAEAHGRENRHGSEQNRGTGNDQGTGEVQERPEEVQESAEERSAPKPAARRKPASGGILPKVASEDEPGSWGDRGGYDHDAWLKEQRPPHWG